MVDINKDFGLKNDRTLGQYLKEIGKIQLLDREKEKELARRVREEGDPKAREELIKANLRFVVNMASKYQNLGLPLADLINEGNIGLIEAANRYDERKGVKFISYAVWWIRQAILYALSETSRPIRIPLNRINDLMKIEKFKTEFMKENNREPTVHDVARYMKMKPEEIEALMAISSRQTSLNNAMGEDGSSELLEFIEDPEQERPMTEENQAALRKVLEEELATLSPRESEVLRLYFGLTDQEKNFTLEEIGKRYGLTRERIRQIKEKGINRLRHGSRSYKLRPFLN